jgi:hypothetical protein
MLNQRSQVMLSGRRDHPFYPLEAWLVVIADTGSTTPSYRIAPMQFSWGRSMQEQETAVLPANQGEDIDMKLLG